MNDCMKKIFLFLVLICFSNLVMAQIDGNTYNSVVKAAEEAKRNAPKPPANNNTTRNVPPVNNTPGNNRNLPNNRMNTPPPTPTFPFRGVNYSSETARKAAEEKYNREQAAAKERKDRQFQQDKAAANSRFKDISTSSQSSQQSPNDRINRHQAMTNRPQPESLPMQPTAPTVPPPRPQVSSQTHVFPRPQITDEQARAISQCCV